jgi:hypothetical protein
VAGVTPNNHAPTPKPKGPAMTDLTAKEQKTADLAVVLTTLAETTTAIESHIYIALDSNIHRHYAALATLRDNKWITVAGHRVTITAAGRELAQEIEAAIQTAPAA